MKSRFAQILDYIFLSIALSCLLFLWIRKLFNSPWLSIFVSFTLGFAISKILKTRSDKKHSKIKLSFKERQNTQKILLHFFQQDEKDTLLFFKEMFSKRFNVQLFSNYLLLDKIYLENTQKSEIKRNDELKGEQSKIHNEVDFSPTPENSDKTGKVPTKKSSSKKLTKPIAIFFDFKSENISTKEIMIAHAKSQKKGAKLYFFAPEFSKKSISLAHTFEDVALFDGVSLHKILQQFDSFPKTEELVLPNKYKQILHSIISKEKTKKYFAASMFLLFGSLFLPYSLYYQIFASICMILTILSYFQKTESESLPFEI